MTVGLLIGRFQPFHNGHLQVVKKLLGECDELMIGIGSAQHSHTTENPFTAGERFEMIRAALDEAKIPRARYSIIHLTDIHNNAMWVNHVRAMCPHFDVVYTRNPLVQRLFKEAGFRVKEQPEFDRALYSGTRIRRAMVEGKSWENLVPPAVAKIIRHFGGVERLKSTIGSD